MSEQESDKVPDAAAGETPPPGGESTEPQEERSDVLSAAEKEAAIEAAEEAKGPKVVRPTSRTSRKAAEAKTGTPEPAPESAATTVLPMETVRVRQSGIQSVSATNVDVSRGGIGRAEATDIAVSQGGIGFARGERVSLEMGGIGAAFGDEVRLTQGAAGAIIARDARVEQAIVRTVVANNVTVERTTGVLFLLARRVDGNVRAVLDWRGALAFGAAFGLISVLFRRRR
jgi:hypothetical protein